MVTETSYIKGDPTRPAGAGIIVHICNDIIGWGEINKTDIVKIPVIISQLAGSLFYINGSNILWTFLIPADGLEIMRKGGWWSFFLLNGILIGDLRIFSYNSDLFKHISMHIYFLTHLLLAILIGTTLLIFPLYLKYFKFAHTGGAKHIRG